MVVVYFLLKIRFNKIRFIIFWSEIAVGRLFQEYRSLPFGKAMQKKSLLGPFAYQLNI
tara:strand:+ start:6026 stop:6199 length:174 start_codon:yes stop_codon:yes gene_type:complete